MAVRISGGGGSPRCCPTLPTWGCFHGTIDPAEPREMCYISEVRGPQAQLVNCLGAVFESCAPCFGFLRLGRTC